MSLIRIERNSLTMRNTDELHFLPLRMQKILAIVGLLIVITACSGSKTTQNVVQNQPVQSDDYPVTSEDSTEAKAFYLDGIIAFQNGEYNDALDLLTNAMIKLPNSAGIQYALADAYLAIEDPSNAIYYANQAAKQEPENIWYCLKVVEIHEKNANLSAAIDELQRYIDRYDAKIELRYKLADLYAKNANLEKSNSVYAGIIKQYGTDEPSHYHRYLNFTQMGKRDSAIVELSILAELNPQDTQLTYSLAELQLSAGKSADAAQTLKALLTRNPGYTQAYQLLLSLYINEKKMDLVGELTQTIMNSKEFGFITKQQFVEFYQAQMNAAGEQESAKNALKLAQSLIDQYPDIADGYFLAGTLCLTLNDELVAKAYLEKTIQINQNHQNAWLELVQLYLRNSLFSLVVEKSTALDAAVPENAFVQYAVGVAYFSLNDNQNAIKWLKNATFMPARREFKSVIQTILGDVFHQEDNWPKASEAYDAAIKLDPNNATALNNYAYYLSVRGEKLNEAKLMSKKSLDIEPDNASFLDTYGWILYQNDLFDDAKIYIQKAIDAGGASAEVFEHMGDVHEKLGAIEEAKSWWNKALELEPNRTHLKEKVGNVQ
ncbi:tetratricopeptide repeat protein [bacterium]|nr:MAG: tetratricopeptide repeat protein [bacterium]